MKLLTSVFLSILVFNLCSVALADSYYWIQATATNDEGNPSTEPVIVTIHAEKWVSDAGIEIHNYKETVRLPFKHATTRPFNSIDVSVAGGEHTRITVKLVQVTDTGSVTVDHRTSFGLAVVKSPEQDLRPSEITKDDGVAPTPIGKQTAVPNPERQPLQKPEVGPRNDSPHSYTENQNKDRIEHIAKAEAEVERCRERLDDARAAYDRETVRSNRGIEMDNIKSAESDLKMAETMLKITKLDNR